MGPLFSSVQALHSDWKTLSSFCETWLSSTGTLLFPSGMHSDGFIFICFRKEGFDDVQQGSGCPVCE